MADQKSKYVLDFASVNGNEVEIIWIDGNRDIYKIGVGKKKQYYIGHHEFDESEVKRARHCGIGFH